VHDVETDRLGGIGGCAASRLASSTARRPELFVALARQPCIEQHIGRAAIHCCSCERVASEERGERLI